MTTERLASDISRDLRQQAWGRFHKLMHEAADKLDGLIVLLAKTERERDDMAKTIRALVKPEGDAWPMGVHAVLASVVGYAWRDPTTGVEVVLSPEDVRLIRGEPAP